MHVYEVTIEGNIRWTQLYLYPPTRKNLLNAVKDLTDKDFSPIQRDFLRNQIEWMAEFSLPFIRDWQDCYPNPEVHIVRRSLRENRVP